MNRTGIALAALLGGALAGTAGAADAQHGQAVFEEWCSGCHEPLPGHGFDPPAGTYTLLQRYQDTKPAALEQRTDLVGAYIRTVVRNGLNVMPRSRKTEVSDADLDDVVAYLTRNNGKTAAKGAVAVRPVLATTLAPARSHASLTVTSIAFNDQRLIPVPYTQNGANQSPPLQWSQGPAGTRSYVVLVEDAGVARPEPIFHWVLYNVPADVTELPMGVPTTPELQTPAGAMNGLNIGKQPGYMGPKPPRGQTHPYHFEVFALDRKLTLKPDNANRDAVVAAMKGHVLAAGTLVGYFIG